jgi:polyisoprenoid-binding protein YceI
MKRSTIGWIVAAVLAFGGAVLAWLFFAGGSGEPSTELTTPTIAAPASTAAPATTSGDVDPSSDTTAEASATTIAEVSRTAFVIDPVQSTASFSIDEVLRGDPQTVIGTTSEVAGQVQVDPTDLSGALFSQIVINARTFTTDSSFRDRAIRGPVILNSASDEFELITFDITSTDLTGAADVGDSIDFTVTGDLLIRGVTQPTTFDVSVTLTDDLTLTGTASTTVSRSDFEIGIPSAPGVADVTDEVIITLDFVAVAG